MVADICLGPTVLNILTRTYVTINYNNVLMCLKTGTTLHWRILIRLGKSFVILQSLFCLK